MLNTLRRGFILFKSKFNLSSLHPYRCILSQRCISIQSNQKPHLELVKRPPVVTIMGHVDHGKTTLLDYLRKSQIVKQEFGGITQHIGAFVVPFEQKDKTELVTFLDTPGHAAFSAMRQRGANVTDIVVLVVASEDGVMEQTVESINFARNSNVPVLVAVNKIDKFTSPQDLDRHIKHTRQQLAVHDVISEEDGGETQLVKISALMGTGIEDLKEAILALAETLELKSSLNCSVKGRIIESSTDTHRGQLCTMLVQEGVLRKGDVLVSGSHNWAKVRALFNEHGKLQQSCGPGLPIQVIGWREERIPAAGDLVYQVDSESEAKAIVRLHYEEEKNLKAIEDSQTALQKAQLHQNIYKEKLALKQQSGFVFRPIHHLNKGLRQKDSIEDPHERGKINLILKCDVDGSLDAILNLLDSYDKTGKQPVKLDIMHFGVGPITDNDYSMACSFKNSLIYGFNVKVVNQKILLKAKQDGVALKMFNVIYHLVDDLKSRLSEMIPEHDQEYEIGQSVVMQIFEVTDKKKKIQVAGCRCKKGTLRKDSLYKLVRDKEVLAQEMRVLTLKHFKDDATEIQYDQECGISLDTDVKFSPGDVLIAYGLQKIKPKLKWDLRGF